MPKKTRTVRVDPIHLHAFKQAVGRFDIYLTNSDLKRIITSIKSGVANKVSNQGGGVAVYQVELPNGRQAYAVYSEKEKRIKTFLTEEMVAA
ncbi:MAG: hypothetical protein A2301_00975 [Candidatus Magasanikbacteria bacterium RIFOXYB2_FULL_40_13]|nr:MAG: hypothetical protein A2301_00975 [Candidatus Magasanikbacteria bacterium RIFOXYB2_FULL_40_13]